MKIIYTALFFILLLLNEVAYCQDTPVTRGPDEVNISELINEAKEYHRTNPSQSIKLINDALLKAREYGDSILVAVILNKLAFYQLRIYQNAGAVSTAKEALEITSRNRLYEEQAVAYNRVGSAYLNMNIFETSAKYYIEGLRVSEKAAYRQGEALSLFNLGSLNFYMKDYSRALDYAFRSLEMREDLNDDEGMMESLNSLGNIYKDLGEYEKALNYYEQALWLAEKNDDKYQIAKLRSNIANNQNQMEYYSESLVNASKAVMIAGELGVKPLEAYCYLIKGEALTGLKDFDEAKNNIFKCIEYAKKTRNNLFLQWSYKALARMYELKGDLAASLKNFKLVRDYTDSLHSTERDARIAEWETIYETEKKARENEYLKKQNQLKEDTIFGQRLLAVASVVMIIALVIFTIFLIRMNKKHSESRRILTEKKNEIEEKNRILKERTTKIFRQNIEINDQSQKLEESLEALRVSEERFRTLVENSPVLIVRYDSQCRHIYISPNLKQITGIGEQEILSKKPSEIKYFQDNPRFWERNIQRVIQTGKPFSSEVSFAARKGRIHLSWNLAPEFDIHGLPETAIGILIDITEKRTAEDQLRKLGRAVDCSSASIIITNDLAEIEYVNSRFTEITGYTKEEVLGKNPNILKPPFKPSLDYKDLWETITAGNVWNGEFHNIRKDGTYFWELVSISPVFDKTGKITHYVAVKDEITERKRMEEELKENRLLLRTIIDTSPFLIACIDSEGRYIITNKKFAEFHTRSIGEIEGNNMKNILPSSFYPKHLMLLGESIKGKTVPFNDVYLPSSGMPLYTYGLYTPYLDKNDDISGVVVVAADITKLKRTESALKVSEQKLKEANATKDKFFSIIAHDLKNPFMTIIGFSEILADDYELLKEKEKKQYIENINLAANTTFRLLENLLQWSRSQRGKIKYKKEKYDLYQIVNDNITLMEMNASKKSIKIESEIEANTLVNADYNSLNTIVRNLISNAVKFTRKGGSIIVSSEPRGNMVEVSVKDDGIGMSEETIKKLFRIDESISREGTASEKGTGLGLIICKEFVEHNGGKIWVESEPDKGTTFYFTLQRFK